MFTLKQRFMLMALLFITALTNAQNIKVTGRILDSEQNPLPGAGVVVSGTNSGTTADIDGKFSVNVPADATLEVSYLGYETQMVKVNSRAVIDVVLEEESNERRMTANNKIFVTKPLDMDDGLFEQKLEQLRMAQEGEIRGLLKEIVPNYVEQNGYAHIH